MSRLSLALTTLLTLTTPTLALAADPAQTLLSLSATGTAQGTPNLLTASLFVEKTDTSIIAAQDALNRVAEAASQRAHAAPAVKIIAGNYDVTHDDNKTHWTARQSIDISSTDSHALLTLVAQLQALGLGLSGLTWSLDPKTREHLAHDAQIEALHTLQAQARTAADALGLHFQRFKTINISNDAPPRGPLMMMSRVATPESTRNTQDVMIDISGAAILTP